FGTLDEFFETVTLIQTLKADPFPVVLYDEAYWGGLLGWMRNTLKPAYIDPEDMDIFRIVNDPKECVRVVREGVKKPWWRPSDEARPTDADRQMPPLSGRKSESDEGTRYGQRPRKTTAEHAKPSRKP